MSFRRLAPKSTAPVLNNLPSQRILANFPTVPKAQPVTQIESKQWSPIEQRTGVLAVKKGMTSHWHNGKLVPATVLQLDDTVVVGHKTQKTDGYDALIVGCRKITLDTSDKVRDYKAHLAVSRSGKLGHCVEKFTEFPVTPNGFLPVRCHLNAAHYTPGQYVDVQSKCKDKGFQGVVKRYGFKGQSASHGTSKAERKGGSIGMRKTPGKVYKGRKMPGQMGGDNVTVHNLEVLKVDKLLNLVYVKGTVPGDEETVVKVRDAVFKKRLLDPYKSDVKFPTVTEQQLQELQVEKQ